MTTIEETARLEKLRTKFPNRKWTSRRWAIEGNPLERWFAKTSINLLCGSGARSAWPLKGPAQTRPPIHMVRATFGHHGFDEPLGLYAAARVGDRTGPIGHVGCGVLLDAVENPAACYFEFHGFRFLFWLLDVPIPQHLSPLEFVEDWKGLQLIRHIEAIRWERNSVLSQAIHFEWLGKNPPNRVKGTRARACTES